MTDNTYYSLRPVPRCVKIISLSTGKPAGVADVKVGAQGVRLDQRVQRWELDKVGDERYRLKINGSASVDVREGESRRVVVSYVPEENQVWEVSYQERNDAFIITPMKDRSRGWTVPHPLSDSDPNQIVLSKIISADNIPQQFIPSQLWKLVSDD